MADTISLSGRLALVTGASGGIGRATCLALAARGASIAVHYYSSSEAANELVKQIATLYPGVRVVAFKADLSTYDGAKDLHKQVVEQMGHPDVLFNNAGATIKVLDKAKGEGIEVVDAEMFEKTWRVNCGTAFELTRLCIPHMEEQKWGRIIFCSSVAALIGGVIGPHYSSSKSALHGLMHWISQRYSASGITSNCVAPALITQTAMLPGSPEHLKSMIPVGRLGVPQEIASVVEMLATNGYLTNKVISVDGGLIARD
ncbi:NAD(P)-binding protein [Exidia glandulosa HHB12029]|uniref:NAD(P)-binding protein n=1 Tax=Exidia glandulosa HHB12029 TaxID=1314781 RepID=A0A165HAX1_EXIGL|nr:NAD(P)-binding protein [Exidia glandulosa HHB12029]